ncbi:AhpD-like protein [Amylocarpus encephaloides]|uniref:AhpD-like protein n=1 Tax=Amylocarpus encephaloides TaxID=45428 RepID=A0A9P8CAK1_9HELO|nr:AhpD-like protein [Amylocarpus encephaloides]
MERFPPVTPSILTPEQKPLYELMDNVTKATYGTTIKLKSSDGALLGPFNPMLYTPTLITPWLQLQANIGALAVARDREIAILACLSQSPAPYGVYAHTIIAKKAGFTEDQVEAMLVARTPRGLGRREAMVWEFSLELTQMKGPMEKDTYKRAEKVLERDGIAALIHTVGAFMYTSVLLNAADVCAPE